MMAIVSTTLEYWAVLLWFIRGKPLGECPYLLGDENRQARVQLRALSLNLSLWNQPHYRHPSYAHDLRANLCNVAVPGSGLPLSLFCLLLPLGYVLVLLGNPVFCFLGAVNVARKKTGQVSFSTALSDAYRQHLFSPDDWFSYWRLNCVLASYYWLVSREEGYDLENKWIFLQKCMEKQVPISPVLTELKGLCIKHKNEEGGLGIHFFKSATDGGDWIIQEVMRNHSSVGQFLPKDAPLSTFRIMTGSRLGMKSKAGVDSSSSTTTTTTGSNGKSKKGGKKNNSSNGGGGSSETKDNAATSDSSNDDIFAFSCVFRAGRSGGLTDHNSVLFDVDVPNKKIGVGTSNMHWYQLGPQAVTGTPWLNHNRFTHHPDGNIPVTGRPLPDIDAMVATCVDAHKALFPGVPVAGWDLCVVDGEPMYCLLEVNLMCNFFKGSFDKPKYFQFIEDYFLYCEKEEKSSSATATNKAD